MFERPSEPEGRLPQELAKAGITGMDAANEFLEAFWPRFNASFAVEPKEPESAFAPLLPSMRAKPSDVLCLKEERTVGADNCVAYLGRKLQIPPQRHRCHYVRAKVSVHEYEDGGVAVFHGTLRLGRYDAAGRRLDKAGAAA